MKILDIMTDQQNKFTLKYYPKWIDDCIASAEYCLAKGDLLNAEAYVIRCKQYIRGLKEAQA